MTHITHRERVIFWKMDHLNSYFSDERRIFLTLWGGLLISLMAMLKLPLLLCDTYEFDWPVINVKNMMLIMCTFMTIGFIPCSLALYGAYEGRPVLLRVSSWIVHWMYCNLPVFYTQDLMYCLSGYFVHLLKQEARGHYCNVTEMIGHVQELTSVHLSTDLVRRFFDRSVLIVLSDVLFITSVGWLFIHLLVGASRTEIDNYASDIFSDRQAKIHVYVRDADDDSHSQGKESVDTKVEEA